MNGSGLADQVGVSREAVSNWLSGQSIPRPKALKAIAEALRAQPVELFQARAVADEPVIAYRTVERKPVSAEAMSAGHDAARHLQTLLPHVGIAASVPPRRLSNPTADASCAREAAELVRREIAHAPGEKLDVDTLLNALRLYGALLVPVLWGRGQAGEGNALSISDPKSNTFWVLLNLDCLAEDFRYWISHELGHCLSLHELRGDEAEAFAEAFAQHLLFPDELAEQCLKQMDASDDRIAIAERWARELGLSSLTPIRCVQRLAEERNLLCEKLDTNEFFDAWRQQRESAPTIAEEFFGSDMVAIEPYVELAETKFASPVFKALGLYQKARGGKDAAFIARALNINVGEAVELATHLWKRATAPSADSHQTTAHAERASPTAATHPPAASA